MSVVNLIIDTDMSVDVDDAGMLCAGHALQDSGDANILAVMHDTNVDAGVGAISAINSYFGRSNIAIGAYRGHVGAGGGPRKPAWTKDGRGAYVDDLVDKFAPPIRNYSQVPPASNVYRTVLAAAANASVTIVAVGFATNLLLLLQSQPDELSPLDGASLVARKVQRMVIMGGRDRPPNAQDVPSEWNFAAGCAERDCSYKSVGSITRRFMALWPTSVPTTFMSYEAGELRRTGHKSAVRNLRDSPCDHAKLFNLS